MRVVRRWIDPDEFDPERVRGHRVLALAERWSIGRRAPRSCWSRHCTPDDRGHLLLLQALARLPRTDCVALLAGDHRRTSMARRS